MFENLTKKLQPVAYVQIWEKRIKVTNMYSGNIFDQQPLVAFKKTTKGKKLVAIGNDAALATGSDMKTANPFSHPRVLFADFYLGEVLLTAIFKNLYRTKLLQPSPTAIIHPMEKTEGGLTMIEDRAFRELAEIAGAREVFMYQGTPLEIHGFDLEKVKAHEQTLYANR